MKLNKSFILKTAILSLIAVLGISVNFVFAQWSPPSEGPTGGNVHVPLNVGPIGQIKQAGLNLITGTAQNAFFIETDQSSMVVKRSGNVGIGTTNPGARLEVNGKVKITDGTQGDGKVLTSDANGLASWATPSGGLPSGTNGQTLRHNGSTWIGSSNIFNNGTNVGIGTDNPGAKLDVNGTMRAYRLKFQSGTDIPQKNDVSKILVVGNDGDIGYSGSSGNVGDVLTRTANGMIWQAPSGGGGGGSNFWTQSGNLLFPNNTAWNVGLGTPNPNTKLHVVGQTRIEAGENANLLFRSDGPFHTRLESVGNINLRPGNRSENSMTLTSANGFVGIGVFSPKSTLYVKRMGGTPTASFYGGGAGSDTHIAIVTQEGNGTVGSRGGQPSPWVHGWSLIGRNNNHNLAFGFWDGGTGNWVNQPMELTTGGDLTIAGTFSQSSDANLKTNIQNLSDSLAKILELRGVTFNWKNRVDEKESIGFIAQEVEQIFPELVKGEDGQKSVNYVSLVPVLVEAVKELDEKNKELEARLEKLEKRLGISF